MKILIFDHTKSEKDIKKAMKVAQKYTTLPLEYEIEQHPDTAVQFIPPSIHGNYHVNPTWFRDNYTVNAKGYDFVVAYFTSKQWRKVQKYNVSKAESINENYGVSEVALTGSFKRKEKRGITKDIKESEFVTRLLHEMCHGMFDHKMNVPDTTHYWHYEEKNLLGAINQWKLPAEPPKAGRSILFHAALSFLGTDATPLDVIPDEYGYAETVNAVHKAAFGYEIGGGPSTYWLYDALLKSWDFIKVDSPEPGDIVISPTGYGSGALPNGHVGIVGAGGLIMSNDSRDGIFWTNYTLDTWRKRYVTLGGYPMVYFRRV